MKLSDKTLAELIDLYIKQVDICNKIDSLDKKTVRANNKAVNTMYEIVELINTKFGTEGINKFATLLDRQEKSTFLWVTPQLLERMQPDKHTEEKALQILRDVANSDHPSALSFLGWFMNWEKKKR